MKLHDRENIRSDWSAEIEFFMRHTMRTEKTSDEEGCAYGILINIRRILTYFRKVIKDNRIDLINELTFKWVNKEVERFSLSPKVDLFSANRHYFRYSLTIIVTFVCVHGAIYEIMRRHGSICRTCPNVTNGKQDERNEDLSL